MRLIIAILQPTKLSIVREALQRIGVERMTVGDALGHGRQRGRAATYRGIEYSADLLRKVYVEIVVNDDFLESTLEVLGRAAKSGSDGEIGDGKIFVVPVEEVYDLASEIQGPGAV